MKNDNLLSVTLGSCVGFIGSLTTDKLFEVIVLSFVGGLLGAAGGTLWRHMKCKWPWLKKRIIKKMSKND